MPVPQKFPIEHYRGDSLGFTLTLWQDTAHTVPKPVTGTVTAQLRQKADDTDPADSWAVSHAGNVITCTLTPAQTAALPASTVWDVQVDWQSDGLNVSTPLQGSLKLTGDVTRSA